jgi:hypothetical protein
LACCASHVRPSCRFARPSSQIRTDRTVLTPYQKSLRPTFFCFGVGLSWRCHQTGKMMHCPGGAGFIRPNRGPYTCPLLRRRLRAPAWPISNGKYHTLELVYYVLYCVCAERIPPGPTNPWPLKPRRTGCSCSKQPRIKVWRHRSSSFITLQSGHCIFSACKAHDRKLRREPIEQNPSGTS